MSTEKYQILEAPTTLALVSSVQTAIANGWQPLGQPFVIDPAVAENGQAKIAQAMTQPAS
jgi:hypothetical protein